MLTHQQNELLCRVNQGAPMGALMKRYWMPACLSSEIAIPGGAPVRSTILDTDVVIFRSPNGKVGAMYEYCPHRGPSLVLARNEENGLRCLYHGWKFGADGKIVEMPTEPPGSRAADHLCHDAYPAVDSGGFIWIYLGPKETMPEFQPMPWASCSPRRLVITKVEVDANWAQAMEGQIDSAHSSMLHSTEIPAGRSEQTMANANGAYVRPSGDANPKLAVKRVPYGMRYVAVRKPLVNPDAQDYMRVTVFVAPCFAFIPPNSRNRLCNITVPRDDNRTVFYFVNYSETTDLDPAMMQRTLGEQASNMFDPQTGRKARNRSNNFLQDRAAMAAGNFTGIQGIGNQDIAMWESMGRTPIIDRSKEHLGGTDVAVVQFRRIMLDAVEDFQKNGTVLGQHGQQPPLSKIRSYEGVVALGTNWELLGLVDEELAIASKQGTAAAE
jgi:phthalate 4,5-dioxygenase oxygenase subunit